MRHHQLLKHQGRGTALFMALSLAGCALERAEPPPPPRTAVVAGVVALLDSIPPLLAREGPLGWLRVFEPSRDFRMASDGRLVFPSLDSATAFLEGFAPTVAAMDLAWTGPTVTPLGPDVAALATGYRESITDTAGTVSTFGGYLTAVARRGTNGWRLQQLHWSSPAP